MGYDFTAEDVRYLTSAAGDLAEVDELELSKRTHLADIGRVRTRFGDRTAALVETVGLRRRGAAKLPDPRRWLLTDDALQQATPWPIARRRARRLAGRRVHDVTCSVGTELAALSESADVALGSDLDRVRLAMAAHNAPGAVLLRADALTRTSRGTTIVADPARRDSRGRRLDPAALSPPLPALLETYRDRDLVVKCAPGLDFEALLWPGEIEVVSLDGGVREACLWSPGLVHEQVSRRASVIRSGSHGEAVEEVTDAMPDDVPDKPPGEWLIDPDGAVVRAGLVRHYAAAHGLWQLDPRIAYLTGDVVPQGARGFRVLERVKFAEKALRAVLRSLDCGTLEILARGVPVDPDVLRKRLAPKGSRSLAVVVTRIGRTPTAFVCEAGVRAGADDIT